MEPGIIIIIGKTVINLTMRKLLIGIVIDLYALGLLSLVSATIREAQIAREKRNFHYHLAKQISHYKKDSLFILKNRDNALFVGSQKPCKYPPYSCYY